MREVKRDSKWLDEDGAMARDELDRDTEILEGQVAGGPTETELVTVALLMRLYDINLALLNHFDPARANEIYDAHEQGGSFNPPVFIPQLDK